MELNLKRPIIFFDLETTGIDIARDRIVEISMVKVMPDGEEIVRTRRINPGMPIPAEATAIHGITDEDVKDCPLFPQIAKSLAQFIEGCDFGGFNSNRFDLPMLVEEFMRAGVDVDFRKRKFIDVQNIFHKMEQRTLVAAYKFYCGKDLFGFGKYKGRSVAEVFRVEPSYYSWMMNGDFPLYTKKIITEIRCREKNEKQ